MKEMENKHGKRQETNSDSDHISPRLRAIAILEQEIAIMDFQYEMALLEYESGHLEDNGDKGGVIIVQKEENSMIQEIEFEKQDKEEDDPERDGMACEDVLNKKDKIQQDEDCFYNRKDDKDKATIEKSIDNRRHHKRKIRNCNDDYEDDYEEQENNQTQRIPYHLQESEDQHNQNRSPTTRRNRDSVIHFSDKEREALVTEEGFYTTEGLLAMKWEFSNSDDVNFWKLRRPIMERKTREQHYMQLKYVVITFIREMLNVCTIQLEDHKTKDKDLQDLTVLDMSQYGSIQSGYHQRFGHGSAIYEGMKIK
ncbi:hypothetical protein Hanom_Chr12g01149421 [Helianthus anomalus]